FLEFREIAKPTPKDNEVLVKIHAASINSWDWELLQGVPFVNRIMAGLFKPTKITILGCDIAGEVEAVGKNITQFQPGDEVFGDLSASGWGGFAEYVAVPEKSILLKPSNMTFEQAAAVPQAGLLALQGLRYKGEIKPGQKILINGASGGTGTFAVQIAKSFGAEVTGVCSTEKVDLVLSVGADHVIDYRQEDFTQNGQKYDMILDVQARHSIFDYRRSLSHKGRYAFVGGTNSRASQTLFIGPFISLFGSRKMGLMLHKANKGLDFMAELLEAGKVVPIIDRCYPLSEVADAMRYYIEGRARGKIVITVKETL
ncbi:MAG: NAD(P)-dependent alcohol dehydrogenase, partial [Chromatiales bacterium]|nr:NAD(P)-dependent alcohol dehydrogenase [Chromatiales bacterium]